jgi:hypothetical protein
MDDEKVAKRNETGFHEDICLEKNRNTIKNNSRWQAIA